MFYESHPTLSSAKQVSALVSLTPSESKRLIARGVAALPEIRQALNKGIIIIARGTSNAFVAEEITGNRLESKAEYTRGCIVAGELRVNMKRGGGLDFVLRGGKLVSERPQDIIREFGKEDVFIKGASALDASGQAGVLAAGADGGTIGYALAATLARGSHLIMPVGLEKLVPSVAQASQKCGVFNYKYSTGLPCALIPVPNGKVVTEVQALHVLGGVSATHVASGGIGGAEGTVVLVLEGSEASIEQAFSLIRSIKGEPPVTAPVESSPIAASLNYDAMAISSNYRR